MRFSLSAVLALCASSALAGSAKQSDVVGKVTIRSIEGFTDEDYISDSECKVYEHPHLPVAEIIIDAPESEDAKCTFYTGPECDGDTYSLRAGKHPFRRPFFVGSYECHEA